MNPKILREVADAIERGEDLRVTLSVESGGVAPKSPVSDAERARGYRDRRRVTTSVTKSPGSSRNVTTSVTVPVTAESLPHTPSLSGRTDGSVQKEAQNPEKTRNEPKEETARVPARAGAERHETSRDAVTDRGRPLTPCPEGISRTLKASGVVKRLAERHQVDEWDVTAALDEFEDYWRSEEREGDPRRLRAVWLGDAQRRVSDRARMGFLRGCGKAPGLEEHAARVGRTEREAEKPKRRPDPWGWQWEPGGPYFGQKRPVTGPEADPNQGTRANGKESHR